MILEKVRIDIQKQLIVRGLVYMIDFTDIIGHEDIIRHFKSSIELGKISQGYIINGETGSGKRPLPGRWSRLSSVRRAVQSHVIIVSHVFSVRREISSISCG